MDKYKQFTESIALLLADGEQTGERQNEGLAPFILENDDAVATLHNLIFEAREMTGVQPDLVDE